MKKLFLLILMGSLTGILFAQTFPTVTIRDIQEVPLANLQADNDTSLLNGDTVIVYGTVMMDGLVDDPQNPGTLIRNGNPGSHHNLWIQSGTDPWAGIDVFHLNGESSAGPTSPIDMLTLVAGDSIKITGFIEEFRGTETEIMPIEVELIGTANQPLTPVVRSVGDFNDGNKNDNRVTGEQWEGMYVEFNNLTIVNIVSGRFIDLQDAAGNVIQMSDRFRALQIPSQGGNFQTPNIGSVYDTVRGVIVHTRADQDGYQLFPFLSSDLVLGNIVPPTITNISTNPLTPAANEDITINASITDNGSISEANLYYSVGASTQPGNYFQVSMTSSGGSTFSGTIPNTTFSDGDVVVYYIEAIDNDTLTSTFPDVPGGSDPNFIIVDDNGPSIRNVQFSPFESGRSSFDGFEVTLRGIVTASSQAGDLGFVYIQQTGEDRWAGLPLLENPELFNLERGDSIEVSGLITERFDNEFQLSDWTAMVVNSVSVISSDNPVPAPVEVNPDVFFRDFDAQIFPDYELTEPYEGMLIEFKNPTGGPLYVISDRPDAPTNFGEWLVGTNPFDINGSRVLAGRRDDRNFSSLSFSYINDSFYLSNFGIVDTMFVKNPCIVSTGDTICSMVGIMAYSFGEWKLFPRNDDDIPSFVDGNGEYQKAFSGANCPVPGGLTTSDCFEANFIGLDVLPEFEGSEVKVYPNPARFQLNVAYELTRAQQGVVELRDLMGRQVLAESFRGKEGRVQLNTLGLVPGTYVVVIRTDNAIIAQNKVLIAR